MICEELSEHSKDMVKTVGRLETVAYGRAVTNLEAFNIQNGKNEL